MHPPAISRYDDAETVLQLLAEEHTITSGYGQTASWSKDPVLKSSVLEHSLAQVEEVVKIKQKFSDGERLIFITDRVE